MNDNPLLYIIISPEKDNGAMIVWRIHLSNFPNGHLNWAILYGDLPSLTVLSNSRISGS